MLGESQNYNRETVSLGSAKIRAGISVAILSLTGAAWATSLSFDEEHKALIADSDFVFEYTAPTPIDPPSQTSIAIAEFFSAFFSFLGPILRVAFWGIVIGVISYLVYLIITEAVKIRRNRVPKIDAPTPVIPAYQPSRKDANIILDDADALAAEGRYAEAVHTLLLRSIQDIRKNRPRAVPKALTSREISTLDILSDTAQSAFRRIGDLVEVSFFGGKPLDKHAFEVSRKAYEEFAFESGASAVRRRS